MLPLRWRVLWIIVNIFGLIAFLIYSYFIWDNFSSTLSNYTKKESEKIDWNDYELIKSDSSRRGFGEHGKGETLTDPEEIKRNDELFEIFGMSVVISDKISVNRSIPDLRHPECLNKKYLRNLPRVSIVIIFNNEIFSTFKRTLHSLYNRTPHELIEEVILINDASTLEHLYDPLRIYIDENFADFNFEIINIKERVGLMQARVIGAKAAKSEFLFIMEPHCEMTYNWLPPLIEPLLKNPRTVTVPIIDNVEWKEMTYYENEKGNKGCRGVFDWELEYQKLSRFPIEEDKMLDPFATPIMTGGIFMIRKNYFFEIGPYDKELLIWGAENLEMSFKINLCGGKLLEVPCSRIGHVFRAFNNFRKHESGIDFLHFNRKRIVEVWFDDFKDYVYQRDHDKFNIDVGDLENAKKFREKLKCKPFKYFLDVIAPDLLKKFPLETPSFASGNIQLKDYNLCLDAPEEPGSTFSLSQCHHKLVNTQSYELTWYRDIRVLQTNLCFDFYQASMEICKKPFFEQFYWAISKNLLSVVGHLEGGNQLFKYNLETQQISNPKHKRCLEADITKKKLKFVICDEEVESQKWIWTNFVNKLLLDNWNRSGRPFENIEFTWYD